MDRRAMLFVAAMIAPLPVMAQTTNGTVKPAVAPPAAPAPAVAGGPHVDDLRGDASVLIGSSCNVVVVRGPDGLLLVDDQRARDYAETRDLLAARYNRPVREIVNTHWHLDHAGGNAPFAEAGAVIVAQLNVKVRLSQPQFMTAYQKLIPASPAIAWPARTFDSSLRLGFGREMLRLVHVARAHTDGDTLVKLERANVLHMGDVFFNGLYPFIDLSSGGSIQGLIHAVDVALAMSDGSTIVVPGHGALASRGDLVAYRSMLTTVSQRVRAMIARGASLPQILADKPAARYQLQGDADRFVSSIYSGYHKLPDAKPS